MCNKKYSKEVKNERERIFSLSDDEFIKERLEYLLQKDIYKIYVDDFVAGRKLDVRARNVLRKLGRNLGEVVNNSEEDVLMMRNCGQKTLDEIKRVLAEDGLRFH